MSKKKKLLLLAAVLVLAAALTAVWAVGARRAQAGSKAVAVTVTHADGTVREFTLRTDRETLWDAMEDEKLIAGRDDAYGKWVTTVDGETADEAAGQYWLFTRAGEWVSTACDATPIADGETYEFFIWKG